MPTRVSPMMDFHSPVGGHHLRQGLTETGSVQNFLLLQRQLLPVSLLFLPQLGDIPNVLLKPDGREGMHHTVNVSGLAIPTEPDDFSLANVDLGERKRD